MKGHVVSALRAHDLLRASVRFLRLGAGCMTTFRDGLASSLNLPPDAVWLTGSGRSALHALVSAMRLPPGAEVLLPGYTCVVVPNVFLHLGLAVRYVDIDEGAFNPGAEAIAAAIGPRTAMVLVAHNFGLCSAGIAGLRARFPQVIFVEDAAHAWASRDAEGRLAGRLGHAAFFSFEFSKPLTTGLGGALVIADAELRARLRPLIPASCPPSARTLLPQVLTLLWHWLSMQCPKVWMDRLIACLRWPARALGWVASTPVAELGGQAEPDYRRGMHPWSAALGQCQLERDAELVALRRAQAERYDRLLTNARGWQRVARDPDTTLLRYPVRIADPARREAVRQGLMRLDIVPGEWFDDVVHPRGSHRHGYRSGDCPRGEAASREILNLPLGLHAELSPRQQEGLRRLAERAAV